MRHKGKHYFHFVSFPINYFDQIFKTNFQLMATMHVVCIEKLKFSNISFCMPHFRSLIFVYFIHLVPHWSTFLLRLRITIPNHNNKYSNYLKISSISLKWFIASSKNSIIKYFEFFGSYEVSSSQA